MHYFYLYLLLCAIIDFFKLKIPNVLTLGIFPLIVIYRVYLDSWDGFRDSVFSYLIVLAVLFIPFVLRVMGAGDVKLLANIGAFIGMSKLWLCFLFGAICSVPISIYFFFSHFDRFVYLITQKEVAKLDQVKFPYSIPFVIGTIIFLEKPDAFNFLLPY